MIILLLSALWTELGKDDKNNHSKFNMKEPIPQVASLQVIIPVSSYLKPVTCNALIWQRQKWPNPGIFGHNQSQ